MRYLNILCIFIFGAFAVKAQLLNPSFELSDSLNDISSWESQQGKATKLSVVNFGFIPLTPAQGNYFVALETDTNTTPTRKSIFNQQFSFADTPASINLQYLYLPENNIQFAAIKLLFTKWNTDHRDTVLLLIDTIKVVADGNQVLLQWNTFAKNLSYQNHILPDSAAISFTNDMDSSGRNIRLYLDAISFSKFFVGLKTEATLQVNVYPNPAKDFLMVDGINIQSVELITMDGKQFLLDTDLQSSEISLQHIPSGMYICNVKSTDNRTAHKLLVIQK